MPRSSLRARLRDQFGGTFSSLSVLDYRRIYFGNMAFQFQNWAQQLTFGWLLLQIGNSPFWLGVGGAGYAVVQLSMGPLSGALADAWERRRVMQLTQLTALTVNALILALLALGWLQIWHLVLASGAMGFAFTLNMPARQSLMAELVPRRLLHNATALHTASLNLSRITGPAMAGFLIAAIGPFFVLLINLVANCWTVQQLHLVRHRPSRPPKPFRPHSDELLGGFRYFLQHPSLLHLLLAVCVANFFGAAYIYLLPAVARDVLRIGAQGLGLLTASMGGGALVGSLLLASRGGWRRKELVIGISGIVLPLLVALVGRSEWLPATMGLLGLAGAAAATINALALTSIQEQVPDELSGRVFGVYALTNGLTPLGSLPAGTLAAQLGTANALSIWGLMGVLAAGSLLLLQVLSVARRGERRPVTS